MAAKKKTSTKKKAASKGRTSASKRKVAQPKAKKALRTKVPAGTVIEKIHKGSTLKVTATADGFRFKGKDWKSLTALAIHITGYKAVSGPRFFGLVAAKAKGGAK